MDVYPINLILASATAWTTIFLGFLPTKNIHADFFARETLKAALAWMIVALASPLGIFHYPLIIAILSFVSWRQFREDNALAGKVWLMLASGLGISLGVILILAVTPRASPSDLTPVSQLLLLASIYLGGSVIGLGYTCHVLTVAAPTQSGITLSLVQRFTGLLLVLVIARAVTLMVNFCQPSHASGSSSEIQIEASALLGLALVVLPTLAGMALRAIHSRAPAKASSRFIAICCAGIFAEILARLLVI